MELGSLLNCLAESVPGVWGKPSLLHEAQMNFWSTKPKREMYLSHSNSLTRQLRSLILVVLMMSDKMALIMLLWSFLGFLITVFPGYSLHWTITGASSGLPGFPGLA